MFGYVGKEVARQVARQAGAGEDGEKWAGRAGWAIGTAAGVALGLGAVEVASGLAGEVATAAACECAAQAASEAAGNVCHEAAQAGVAFVPVIVGSVVGKKTENDLRNSELKNGVQVGSNNRMTP